MTLIRVKPVSIVFIYFFTQFSRSKRQIMTHLHVIKSKHGGEDLFEKGLMACVNPAQYVTTTPFDTSF